MVDVVAVDALGPLMDVDWAPMRQIRQGAMKLDGAGRARVARRVHRTVAAFDAPKADRPALRRFFSFLSQVEVIAIEVPLAAMPTATASTRALFERQLEDEVFHALVFATLARELGGLDAPVPEAERLLDQIREQEDPRTTAVLLNAIAEGWIENLFEHAATWGVADDVFRVVLVDEARHVQEAGAHAAGVDARKVERPVRSFEEELFKLVQHPRVMLPVLAVAGEEAFQRLSWSFLDVHKQALGGVGLAPDPGLAGFDELRPTLHDRRVPERERPRVVPMASQWRRTALELWDTPRNPVMNGWFDARVDHVPRRLLTPVLVAAVGRVWKEYPRMNRYAWGGRLYEPQRVNVGVRVALGDQEEALSTIVVPDADQRSVRDIVRIVQAGVNRMNAFADEVESLGPDPDAEALATILRDDELMAMVPPETVTCPVTVSNVGRAGLQAGFGSMPGALGQSVELIMGRVERRPQWRTWRYKPTDTVTIGAGADHRVVDGNHCAEAMRRIREGLTPAAVKEIRKRPDTLAVDEDVEAEMQRVTGFSTEEARIMMSCKLPVWLGWLCWIYKK